MPTNAESRYDSNCTQLHRFLVFRGLGMALSCSSRHQRPRYLAAHVSGQMALQVRLSHTEIISWEQTDRQRHQITVKDIWGAHLQKVGHFTSNGTVPARLLAITKDLYVETMLAFGEGQTSSAGFLNQDACWSGCPTLTVSESEEEGDKCNQGTTPPGSPSVWQDQSGNA